MRRHGGRRGLPGSGDGLTARKRSSVGARSAMLRRPVPRSGARAHHMRFGVWLRAGGPHRVADRASHRGAALRHGVAGV